MSMLDYLAEMGPLRAYNLTLTFLGAGTGGVHREHVVLRGLADGVKDPTDAASV